MIKENKDKQTYNTKMCIYCENRQTCDKNKFKVYVYENKTVMTCTQYKQQILKI